MNENENENAPEGRDDERMPLGFWLRTVDALIARRLAEGLAAEGVSRREAMVLWALARAADDPERTALLSARLKGSGKRLRSLVDRGWVQESVGRWELTAEGVAVQQRLAAALHAVRAEVASAVPAEDFATMTASLRAIAAALGGDESAQPHAGGPFARWGGGNGAPMWFGGSHGLGADVGPVRGHRHGPGRGFGQDCGHAEQRAPGPRRGHGFGAGTRAKGRDPLAFDRHEGNRDPLPFGDDHDRHAQRGHDLPEPPASCDGPHPHRHAHHRDRPQSERAQQRRSAAGDPPIDAEADTSAS